MTLAWNPGSGSAIAGYRLYEGAACRTYTNVIDVGNVTTKTVTGLVGGATYFFAVTAYNTNGQESDFSGELSYTVPLPTNTPPTIALTAPVDGASFAAPVSISLAATVTAMHHASQTTAVLQLDPPGLGNLSVHLALGQNGHVNVLFVPSTPQTAQLLNAGMDGLRQAMAATGLTLGQAGVSGGGAQNPGQHGANNQRATTSTPSPVAAVTPAAATPSGVSAYA